MTQHTFFARAKTRIGKARSKLETRRQRRGLISEMKQRERLERLKSKVAGRRKTAGLKRAIAQERAELSRLKPHRIQRAYGYGKKIYRAGKKAKRSFSPRRKRSAGSGGMTW